MTKTKEMKMQEILKGKIAYIRVDDKMLKILGDTLKHIGKENPIKIGDIVAMDENGCRLSSEYEITEIPKEKIIAISKNMGILAINNIEF